MPRKTLITSIVVASLLACVVLLLRLGHKPLVAWDEGIYAEVSREMLSGGWLAPHWNAQLWFEKPPLLLWLTAVLFKLFGVSEFTARAVSALSGGATAGLLHGWLLRRYGRLAAWLSTFMLLSTFGFLHICSLGETDVLLSLACMVALFGLVQVQERRRNGWYWFWGGFAVALMTKGAASIVLLLAVLVMALVERWRADRLRKPFALGFLLFLVAVLPWHVYMFHRFGQAFLREYLGFHVLSRATMQIEGHVTHPWYYLGVLLLSAAPWVLLYPFAVAASFRKPGSVLRSFSVFALVVLVFFSAVQTRLPHYIAPVYPALTLVTAVYAAEKLRTWGVPGSSSWVRAGWIAAAVALWGLGALATDAPRKKLHSAKLGRGAIPPDNREMAALLKAARQGRDLPAGPLLLWSKSLTVPIAPAVFYAQRPVQQVQLLPADLREPLDKYLYSPQLLGQNVSATPRLLLLDRTLLPQLPTGYVFTPIEEGKTLALGSVARVP